VHALGPKNYGLIQSELLRSVMEGQNYVPYFIVYRPHHAILGLFDSNVEALSLTLACHVGRSVAYRAIRIHPEDRLATVRITSGKHLSCDIRRIGLHQIRAGERSAKDGQKNNIHLRSTHDNNVRSPSNPAKVFHKVVCA
jgi:hypothetical protein